MLETLVPAVLSSVSAIFALAAAYFWFRSAEGQPPPPKGYWGQAPETDPFLMAFRRSLQMNRWGAICAGISAAALAGSLFTN